MIVSDDVDQAFEEVDRISYNIKIFGDCYSNYFANQEIENLFEAAYDLALREKKFISKEEDISSLTSMIFVALAIGAVASRMAEERKQNAHLG